jgi:predicted ArsR family transcriptional regulator
MLEKILSEIQNGGSIQPAVLAKRLDTSPQMIEMMLEDLERRGLLVQVNQPCEKPCGGCPLVGECSVKSPQGRMWMVVQKS